MEGPLGRQGHPKKRQAGVPLMGARGPFHWLQDRHGWAPPQLEAWQPGKKAALGLAAIFSVTPPSFVHLLHQGPPSGRFKSTTGKSRSLFPRAR